MQTTRILIPLRVSEIYPHPDNPRKDLGDISELTESIKKNGIMQNLTVIPGHHVAKEGWSNEGYTLLIGHRRFAAAKAAGLLEVPCKVVKESTPKEQIAIMLEENMQRNDLTIYEQAQSFQLMLDLGDTAQGIAQKTGFSESTIYHRLNIAKLDQKALKEREQDEEAYQLTIKDMIELEKVKSIDTRNKILQEATNSDNLRWRCINAAKEENKKDNWEKVEKALKDAGIECESTINAVWSSDFKKVLTIKTDEKALTIDDINKIYEFDSSEVTYAKSWDGTVYLLKKIEKEEVDQVTQDASGSRTEPLPKKRDDLILNEMFEAMISEMQEFVENINDIADKSKLNDAVLTMMAWEVILNNGYECSLDIMCAMEYKTNHWNITYDQREAIEEKRKSMNMLRQYLYIIEYEGMYTNRNSTTNIYCEYDSDAGEEMLNIYNLLKELGYSPSNEEWIKVIDGTHELFKKDEE